MTDSCTPPMISTINIGGPELDLRPDVKKRQSIKR